MDSYLEQHELIVDVASDLPLIKIDFMMMEQALLNLLHNAVVHTPPGTRVRITAKVDGSDLVLSVADRGPGLLTADLNKVFDKFYRAPNAKAGGIGLGLSITKGWLRHRAGGSARRIAPMAGRASSCVLPLATRPPCRMRV